METFTELKALQENPSYREHRRNSLKNLRDDLIDKPIVDIINAFNKRPYCFTLQSCYGHFVHTNQKETHTLEPLPVNSASTKIEYRIAYIAVCIENCGSGREFFENLKTIPAIDRDYVQFCCAEWFWKRQVNSYVLQVEPDRFKRKDIAILDYEETLHVEKIRNQFFIRLSELVENSTII